MDAGPHSVPGAARPCVDGAGSHRGFRHQKDLACAGRSRGADPTTNDARQNRVGAAFARFRTCTVRAAPEPVGPVRPAAGFALLTLQPLGDHPAYSLSKTQVPHKWSNFVSFLQTESVCAGPHKLASAFDWLLTPKPWASETRLADSTSSRFSKNAWRHRQALTRPAPHSASLSCRDRLRAAARPESRGGSGAHGIRPTEAGGALCHR